MIAPGAGIGQRRGLRCRCGLVAGPLRRWQHRIGVGFLLQAEPAVPDGLDAAPDPVDQTGGFKRLEAPDHAAHANRGFARDRGMAGIELAGLVIDEAEQEGAQHGEAVASDRPVLTAGATGVAFHTLGLLIQPRRLWAGHRGEADALGRAVLAAAIGGAGRRPAGGVQDQGRGIGVQGLSFQGVGKLSTGLPSGQPGALRKLAFSLDSVGDFREIRGCEHRIPEGPPLWRAFVVYGLWCAISVTRRGSQGMIR